MINTIEKAIHGAVIVFTWIAACAAALTMIVIVVNVIGRFFFRQPLHGTIEIVEIMTVVVVYSVLPYAELRRRHVHVELVVANLPGRVRVVLASIMCFAGTAFFLTMGVQACRLTWANLSPSILATDTLSIPFAPFVLVIAIGSLLLGLEMLINALHPQSTDKEQGGHK
jgi:TRAP-type C4-dicarboxylate transport system permease small subunit